MSANIRFRHGRRWVATVAEEGKHVGGFGYLPVTVLTGDLEGQTAQGRVISKPERRLKIRGTGRFSSG